MNITICVGSSCYLKGSINVLNRIQELVADNKLEAVVDISAAFCQGNCVNGVSVQIDGELVSHVTPDNVDEVFKERILNVINK